MKPRQNTRRWLLMLAGTIGLLAYLYLSVEVRVTPKDSRPIGSPEMIEELASRDDLNILFILIDTLRADRLSLYGYERETSPFIDRLAEDGIHFARNLAQSSWTKASMASLWTSLNPIRAGVTRFDQAISEEAEMPAELLKAEGYRTVGLYRNGWVSGYFGFEQGFDDYHKPLGDSIPASIRRENPNFTLKGTDQGLITDAIEYLRIYGDEKWFLYLHLMDIHEYLYDEDSALFGTTNSDVYDNSIRRVDSLLEELYAYLARSGHLEKTIIVIASDHGEAFGERGFEGHAREVFAETTETPLVISLPFRMEGGVVVESRTANIDLWPTLLDLLGIPGREADGRSQLPDILAAATGGSPPEARTHALAHLDVNWGNASAKDEHALSVVDGPLRLVARVGPRGAINEFLFDARTGEVENIIHEQPEEAERFREIAREYLRTSVEWTEDVPRLEIDEMELNQLRALGYQLP